MYDALYSYRTVPYGESRPRIKNRTANAGRGSYRAAKTSRVSCGTAKTGHVSSFDRIERSIYIYVFHRIDDWSILYRINWSRVAPSAYLQAVLSDNTPPLADPKSIANFCTGGISHCERGKSVSHALYVHSSRRMLSLRKAGGLLLPWIQQGKQRLT